jgi:aspartate aminotransferase-like enzyme
MTFGTFFLPGPTEVRPAVLQAMLRPMISHRGAEFERMFAHLEAGLRQVFGTERPVYISTSSATGMMEAGVRCAPEGRVLSLVNGGFSARFAAIAGACGRDVDCYEVPWGEAHEPAVVRERLGRDRYAIVTVVHSETSTGVLNDVRAINDVAHEMGVYCAIDSVSGIGGAELRFDASGLDYVLTGSQKALALPPGLALAVASERFLTAGLTTAGRGIYFDLSEFEEYARDNQTPNTPALSLFYAAERQIADIVAEGIDARWARHRALAQRTADWVSEMRGTHGVELSILAPVGQRSPTVSVIVLPAGLRSDVLLPMIAERGYTVGSGYGKLGSASIRIGHMGDHTMNGLDSCLAACADALLSQVGRSAGA